MADSPTLPKTRLRVADVVAEYGLNERHVRNLVATRRIPYYKIGKTLMFDRVALDAWSIAQSKLRVADVVAEYGLTERQVRHLVSERRIPFQKVGKYVMFDRDALDAWFEDKHVDAETGIDAWYDEDAG